MQGGSTLVLIAVALLWGLDTGELGFFAVPTVLALAGSRLVLRSRTLWKVVAIVFGVGAAAMMFWTAFGLTAPGSVFDFVPGILMLPGLLITLVAGIAAIRSGKNGLLARAEGTERRAMQIIVGGVAVLAALSSILTLTGRETVSGDLVADADLVVNLTDFEFDQGTYSIGAGDTILVKNSDPFHHTFNVDALGLDVSLNPGSEKLITIPTDAAGTFVLYCEPHTSDKNDPSADDMAATITVG